MLQRTTLMRTALAAMVLIIVPIAGCGGSGSTDSAKYEGSTPTAAGDSDRAPDFTLPDVDGKAFQLSATEGRVRLIDFWATWCAPCREEIPMLKQLERTYAEHGLTVVAISDEDLEVINEFVADQGIEYTNLVDPGDVSEDYGVLGLPTAFLLDRNGKILEHYIGPKPHRVLEAAIREALELPPAT